ncbi:MULTISPECIES: Nif3-like dinuclear metal center hexameric protein [Candidatus Ichthyocystis]|uniref:Putative NIF3 family protein n=1 Tax=Candidatus Ichthyocystis hellenicum TaxID=1561003 RepID=A0A0S4M2B4_9BURK|nr:MULTISPECIES: Nif3-like dinuclear metal center hexameric protein [Ichthyocystis]CUT17151.1 putative NIF3 family protein [Candidatus Ichthyocystis hellenicum]
MDFSALVDYTDELLQVKDFSYDYCINGVHVSTDRDVKKIFSGVTASLSLINRAVNFGADVIIVHHGLFWFSDPFAMTGTTKDRVAVLLEHDIGVLAYHLPLDAHPTLGNNFCLARLMGWRWDGVTFGRHQLGFIGSLEHPLLASDFSKHIGQVLNRQPLLLCSDDSKLIRRVAWITGAGQSYFKDAVSLGVDAFVTGEVSEFVYHLAMETGVAYVAAGHHATERYGVQALSELLASTFGLSHRYSDLDNPV